jgi:hypothetical protein
MTTTPTAATAAPIMFLLGPGFRVEPGRDVPCAATGGGVAGGGHGRAAGAAGGRTGSRGGAAAAMGTGIGTGMAPFARGWVASASSTSSTGATRRSDKVISALPRGASAAAPCSAAEMAQNCCVDTRSGGT